jgi:cell division protein FtsB
MKFHLFHVVQIVLYFFICLYLTIKFTFGENGILEYYKLRDKIQSNKISFNYIAKENDILLIKIDLLNEKSVNCLYLQELAKTKLQFAKEDEKLIILNNET